MEGRDRTPYSQHDIDRPFHNNITGTLWDYVFCVLQSREEVVKAVPSQLRENMSFSKPEGRRPNPRSPQLGP